MARYRGSLSKWSRREGVALSDSTGVIKALNKRDYPPGQHTRRKRYSDYGTQLREKQKLKRLYGMMEKQFRIVFKNASKSKLNTENRLLELLEMRLDNVVFRLGWGVTRNQARQIVTHGHVNVDGKRLNVPSFHAKPGTKIEINAKGLKSELLKKNIAGKLNPPAWLLLAKNSLAASVSREPQEEEIQGIPVNVQQVIEFYSR